MKLFLYMLLWIPSSLFSQASLIEYVSIVGLKESTAFPFTRFLPIHPGGEVIVTMTEKSNEKAIRNWNLAFGGFHHKKIANAFYLRGEYAYRPILKSLFTLDMIGYAGYMHTFYPGEVYERDRNSGEFEKTRQIGRPHALVGLGIGITFINSESAQPFIRQELAFESPFANGIPVMIHSFLKIGLALPLKNQ